MALPKHIGDRLKSFELVFRREGAECATTAAEHNESVTGVGVQAASTNAGIVYVGSSAEQRWELPPGAQVSLNISRLSEVYVRGNVGDKVNFLVTRTTGEVRRPTGA